MSKISLPSDLFFSLQQNMQKPLYLPCGKIPIPFLDRSARLLLGQRGISKIWLDDLEFGEERLGLVVLDAGMHDNIIAYLLFAS